MAERLAGFPRTAMVKALEYAGLKQTAMKSGPHPDHGGDCLYLEATIQQYSAFLTALAVQHRTADAMSGVTEQVQLQTGSSGDTRFWLPGVSVVDIGIPGQRAAS